jgi:drug/metabolite transporter (DMT)-like permease
MELWIPLTIAAAFFQNIRSALQKHLKGKLTTLGAAYVRFFYAWPIALVYFFTVIYTEGQPLPGFSTSFLLYALTGGVCQIMFTVFLLWLFSFHNFAVGTTISKLETVMVAIFGLILLGDEITAPVIVAIAMSSAGLVILSAGQAKLSIDNLVSGLWRPPTLIGLACAAWLGLSVVLFRAASLSLGVDNYLVAASVHAAGRTHPANRNNGSSARHARTRPVEKAAASLAPRGAGRNQRGPGIDWLVQRVYAAKRNLCARARAN